MNGDWDFFLRRTHAHKASKLGLSNNSRIGMMNWGPQSKTLLESDSSEANNFAESLVSFRDKD